MRESFASFESLSGRLAWCRARYDPVLRLAKEARYGNSPCKLRWVAEVTLLLWLLLWLSAMTRWGDSLRWLAAVTLLYDSLARIALETTRTSLGLTGEIRRREATSVIKLSIQSLFRVYRRFNKTSDEWPLRSGAIRSYSKIFEAIQSYSKAFALQHWTHD